MRRMTVTEAHDRLYVAFHALQRGELTLREYAAIFEDLADATVAHPVRWVGLQS